ncbi:hypothetical protein GFC30_1348 [Anoxybacillus amylolyticus]|uniref:Uncharacterized protein n=1 Tax=Anoxybacteroides amylolyticum TaxID=294699 RepID=A0A160F169_9BACL|nr:hypothetical protein GFC30_1348 [Anoxybacillus amylolyticus]
MGRALRKAQSPCLSVKSGQAPPRRLSRRKKGERITPMALGARQLSAQSKNFMLSYLMKKV